MKTIFKPVIISLLIIIGIALAFSNCRKDKTYPVVITVRLLTDTSKVVPGANVKIYSKIGGNLQYAEGTTDGNGQFRHTFKFPAILNIAAELKTNSIDSLYGTALIQLVAGETVYKTVYINP